MDISYREGTLLWYWFENWIVVGGFAVALAAGLAGLARSGWGKGGLLHKTLIVLAILAALPLTLLRIGLDMTLSNVLDVVDIPISNAVKVGYLSLAGVTAAVALGGPYLVPRKRVTDEEWTRRVGPLYRTAAMVCDHYLRRTTDEEASTADLITSIALVLQQLPPVIKALGTSPEPTSRESRQARKSFQRALRQYLASATLANKLYLERETSLSGDVDWEGVQGRVARNRVAMYRAQVSSKSLPASREMAKVDAYFASQGG